MPVVVLGVTGCIGAYKAAEVLRELQKRDVDVHVVMTEAATRFVSPMTMEALSRHPVFLDQFALGEQSDIRHISLADAADLLLVAPATANSIGKFARGIADDALSTLYTATRARVAVAPAMNVNMFEHPAVVENLEILRGRGVTVIEPGAGYLACGWLGKGRLAEVGDIVEAAMSDRRPAAGHVGARRCSSPRGRPSRTSTPSGSCPTAPAGAWATGWPRPRVTAARGSSSCRAPRRSPRRRASSTSPSGPPRRWRRRWRRTRAAATVVVMAAAVSDYRPAQVAVTKVKKGEGGTTPRARTDPRHPARPGGEEGIALPRRFRGGDRPRSRERAQEARGEEPGPDRGQRRHSGRRGIRRGDERRGL